MKAKQFTQEVINHMRSIFEYKDGSLYWKAHYHKPFIGKRAGVVLGKKGYEAVTFQYNGERQRVVTHRVIWMLHNGVIPDGVQIDHIDRNPANNKIENLRLSTVSQNNANVVKSSLSETGVKNVRFNNNKTKLQVAFKKDGKTVYCGSFLTLEEAKEVADRERVKLFGEFALA